MNTPRRRRKEARPAELAEAALSVFVEKGFAATRLDDVAARAGVSKGTVYLYFDSKEALFKEVIRKAVLPAIERGETRMEQHQGNTANLLNDLLWEWMQLLRSNPLGQIPKLIIADSDKFPELARMFHDTVVRRARVLIRRVLAAGVAAGEFRIDDVDMVVEMLVATLLLPAIERNAAGFRTGRPPGARRYLDTVVHVVLHGVHTGSPPRA